jgi:hypothetical protein
MQTVKYGKNGGILEKNKFERMSKRLYPTYIYTTNPTLMDRVLNPDPLEAKSVSSPQEQQSGPILLTSNSTRREEHGWAKSTVM